MRRILRIAWREFLDTVQTKIFLLSLLMVPLIIGIGWYVSRNIVREKKGAPARKVAVTNLAEGLSDEIRLAFEKHNASGNRRRVEMTEAASDEGDLAAVAKKQKELVRQGKLDLYVVLEKDIATGRGKMLLYARSARLDDMETLSTVENLVEQAVTNLRCRLRNLSPELLQELRRRVPVERVLVEASSGKERRDKADFVASSLVPFFFMFMMFMGIFSHNQHMMTSIIEEKNSRIIEVLLSAVSPFQLLAGKVLALGGIGLTVMGIWTAAAVVAARWRGLALDVSPQMIAYFIVYYVMGFLLVTCILAAIGSICNTLKEAQSLLMPVSLLFVVPMVSWFSIAQDPQGLYARVLSFIPPLTPMVMILRLSSSRSISVLEVLASMLVLGASVPAAIWAGAKIFRTGILLYGKKPQVREVVRWLRQS
jgi:ABC-2 type transport system permease protein